MKLYYEKEKMDVKWIERFCKGNWENCVCHKMEESSKPHPDGMLPDGSINEKLRS